MSTVTRRFSAPSARLGLFGFVLQSGKDDFEAGGGTITGCTLKKELPTNAPNRKTYQLGRVRSLERYTSPPGRGNLCVSIVTLPARAGTSPVSVYTNVGLSVHLAHPETAPIDARRPTQAECRHDERHRPCGM